MAGKPYTEGAGELALVVASDPLPGTSIKANGDLLVPQIYRQISDMSRSMRAKTNQCEKLFF